MKDPVDTFEIRVIPNAKRNDVLHQGDKLRVYLTAPPADGRANKALIELLARHFEVKKRCVSIIKGEKSRDKVVRIDAAQKRGDRG